MTTGFVNICSAAPALKLGDSRANAAAIADCMLQAQEKAADLLVLPRLALTGCSCGDLFYQPALARDAEASLAWLLEETADCPVLTLVGLPVRSDGRVYECIAAISAGRLLALMPQKGEKPFCTPPEGWSELTLCGEEVPFGRKILLRSMERPELTIGVDCEALSAACRELGLYLFLDGARLGYGLMAEGYDVTMQDIARLCDVFYIGGTKVGALFGEAVVISNPALKEDFRYIIKQRGGMLAKGRLLGVQFDALMTDNLYFEISAHAIRLADKIRATLAELGVSHLVPGITNQIFPILSDKCLEQLAKEFCFTEMERVSDTHRAIRFCTSWATTEENVDKLCQALRDFANL